MQSLLLSLSSREGVSQRGLRDHGGWFLASGAPALRDTPTQIYSVLPPCQATL